MARKRLAVDRPTKSDQDRRTPPEFLAALEWRFGKFVFDLAAKDGDEVLGLPHFTPEQDSLKQDWCGSDWVPGMRWLNPPFSMFPAFTEKAARECSPVSPILMLTLGSIDSNWYWGNVEPHAISFAIDRIQFVGEESVFTKPLLLNLFGFGPGGIRRWRWKAEQRHRLAAASLFP